MIETLRLKSWEFLYPLFEVLHSFGVLRHFYRQPHLLGTQRHGTTEDLIAYLASQGFHNHFVAWVDPGQVKSLRRKDGSAFQWHLRIFKDGELRGHYERTPESAPLAHFMEWGMEPRHSDFVQFLGPWLLEADTEVAGKTSSQRAPATSRVLPSKG